MATAPTRKPAALHGIARANPPSRSICRVCAPCTTAPAAKNSSDLKMLWFQTCRRQPPNPSTTHPACPVERPSRAMPSPIRIMPMFSTLW